MMKLNLTRPLVIFDLETTGTDVAKDRIVEIAAIKIMPDGTTVCRPEKRGKEHRVLVNPEMPIPVGASAIHHIYDEDVAQAPTFRDLAPRLFKFLFDCDLGGFNSNKFDIPLLAEEFLRAGIDFSLEGRRLIDVQTIYHTMEPRNLRAAFKFYCDKQLEDAHEALPDAMATYEVLLSMIGRYEDAEREMPDGTLGKPVQNDMDALHRLGERRKKADLAGHLAYSEDGKVTFNFGKYKAQPVEEVLSRDPGYFSWMMNAEFPLYTKKVLREIREQMKSA